MARDTLTPRPAAGGAWRRALMGCAAVLLVVAMPTPATARPMDPVAASAQTCAIDGGPRAERLVGAASGDVICGRGGGDRLHGKAGSDRLDGGPGDDGLFGGAGADDLDGGPGDDGLGGGLGPDELSGGPGRDIAYYGQRLRSLRVSIGDRAKDGAAREGDVVHSDVEDVQGGRGNDVLIGNGRANRLLGGGGRDRLRGRGGDDVLMGGGGRDRVDARDGAASVDRIACGGGDDTALVDPADVVDADCENVIGGGAPLPSPNNAPSGIALSNASVAENQPAGTAVGTLSAGDPDPGDTHAFALVPGAGSTDNGSFQIAGSTLRTAAAFDFEGKSSYSIRVRATDFGTPAGQIVREFTIAVTDIGESPTITTTAAPLPYTEGAPATEVDDGLTVSDDDDANLEDATVEITAGLEAGDELLFTDQNGITGNFAAGTLTLTGTATVAQYQTALRSVEYRHNGDAPEAVKTVVFRADDGDGLGPASSRAIDVTPVNDVPLLTATVADLAYTEGAGHIAADSGVTVTDPDSAQLSGATVQITSSFAAVDDELAFADQLGISGAYDDVTGTLTLSGNATVADYQAALRAVTYQNSSQNPTGTRTLTFTATDGAATSAPDTRDIALSAAPDAPVLTTSGGATAYQEGDPPTAVDAGLTVTDVDDTNLESATVEIATGLQAGDELLFTTQNGITGSFAAGTLALTGSATVAQYQTALRSVQYRHTGDAPVAAKTVEFIANDGDTDSAAATKNLNVIGINDGPTITTTAAALTYTENDGPVAIDGGLAISDPDSTQLSGASVAITGNHQQAQDELDFADTLGITGAYNDATGTLTLSGTTTAANYQIALRSVRYANSSEGPTPATRTISFAATDSDGAASNVATRGIAITAVNDPPSAVNDTGTTDEDTPLNVPTPGVLANDTDLDPGDTKTVDRLNGSATLTGTSAQGAAVTINANGSYTYNPGSIFQGLSTGQSDTDSFTYRVSDGGGASSTATVNLTITGVSDAPVGNPDSFDAIGNTALSVGTSRPAGEAGKVITGSLLANDTDVDTLQANLVAVAETKPTNLGGSITIEADGNFTYHPDDGDVGATDTVTYTVSDGVASSSGTLSLPLAGQVWYVQNDEPAGGDGTSDTPFDTLAEAETASGTGDTVYVFDGDNTAADLNTGFVMEANERLIGEHNGVSLAGHALHPGASGSHPTLSASGEDVVAMAAGSTLDGVNLDPVGAGGGISSGAGAVTINDVNVADAGTAGTQPGVDLDGTTGATVSDLAVSTNGATGVRLNNAGTVNFAPASTITISTAGARGLDATGTALGTSTFDAITVTGSGNGGVSLTNTTGTTTFGDLSLTTTSGSAPAFSLNNAGTVSVPSAGTANLSATGGPAVDVTGTTGATLAFDAVSSTNSAGDGINLAGLGTGTFSTASGTIAGASGIAFDLDGGSGAVTYPGALNDGTGQAAEITGRSGGTVTLSGVIADGADAGGGISLSSNTGGSTTFSNASKVLNATTGNAISFTASDGHTLTLSGGGLDIDTTAGQGIFASNSGTLDVDGTGNTVNSGTGRAVNVANTDFGASGFTFQSVSSSGAPNGILLNNTGTTAGMTITGTGANNSGGSIQNATEHGVSLTTTQNFSADELSITGANFAGVDGTDVTNFTFTDGEILNAGDSLTDNLHGAIAFNDQAVGTENNIDGTLVITGNLLKDHYGGGVDVFNRNGTISDATVSNNTIDSVANEALSREDAISFNLFGSAGTVANLTKAQIEDNVITDHPSGNGIAFLGAQTNTGAAPVGTVGVPGSATNRILIDGNLLTGDPVNRFGGAAILAGVEGRGVGNFDITNNGTVASPITNVGTHGIATGNSGSSEVEYLIQNNRVTAHNFEAGGLGIRSASDQHIMVGGSTLATPNLETIIDNNVVRDTTGGGIRVLASNSNGTSQVRVTNNDVAGGAVGSSVSAPPIAVENGSSADAAFNPTMCATISANTTAANVTASANVFPGILLAKRTGQLGITGGLTPSPAPNATTESFLTTLNPNSSLGAGFYDGKRVVVNVGDNLVSCTHPPGF